MYTVYVLYSSTHNKIYIGFSSDVARRLISHNHPKNKGWTSKFKPWVLVYSENFELKSMAMNREKELKCFQGRIFVWNQVKLFLHNKD
jgi:putative endonuclease